MADDDDVTRTDDRVREIDTELRELEQQGKRDTPRFGELSGEREQLLNDRDDRA